MIFMKKVKICGITDERETEYLNEAAVDYMGMVMFFPKSKRNIPVEKAASIIKCLKKEIVSVAVTVCPNLEQIRAIEGAGIQMIQIHGDISDDVLNSIQIPVLKAFNVHDLSDYEKYHKADIVKGYIFDAQVPGSGKTFDWSVLNSLPRDEKFAFLAGGLNPENVAAALAATKLDGADTSSGVENESGTEKDGAKILEFVRQVRGL